MPGGDRTGPMGMGPMSGRAAGYCAGYGVPGYMNPWPGYGFGGRGRGGGRGRRNMYYATGLTGWQRAAMGYPTWNPAFQPYVQPGVAPAPEQQLDVLKAQAEHFENILSELKKRIEQLETEKTSE